MTTRSRISEIKKTQSTKKEYIYDIFYHYLFSFRTLDDYCKLQIIEENAFNDMLMPGLNNSLGSNCRQQRYWATILNIYIVPELLFSYAKTRSSGKN
jgi:hypothetical protein